MNKVLTVAKNKCIDCGKEFEFSPAEQKFYLERGFSFPKRCPDCREAKKADVTKITCIDCGVEFEINGYEKEYFARKGYELPKRCRSCRDFKKKKNEEREARAGGNGGTGHTILGQPLVVYYSSNDNSKVNEDEVITATNESNV